MPLGGFNANVMGVPPPRSSCSNTPSLSTEAAKGPRETPKDADISTASLEKEPPCGSSPKLMSCSSNGPVGNVGTGFDDALLRSLRSQLDRLAIAATPFTRATGLPKLRVHWVRPEMVVQVAFTEWTVHDKLRHPRLLGFRLDKAARDVVRERG